jgi:type II secretory pathway predicted ATPase ExeA
LKVVGREHPPLYGSHFGLMRQPFAETVDPSAFVPLPSRVATLNRLRHGLESGPGAVAACGSPGTGKTLLARKLAESLGGPFVHMGFTAMPAAELMAMLAEDLDLAVAGGLPTSAPARLRASKQAHEDGGLPPGPFAASIRRIRSALATWNDQGERPLVIVDEAHLIEDEATFEALRLILNFATHGTPALALALLGGPELMTNLPPSLADRLGARCALLALTASESAAFIAGRLALAGANSPLFDSQALAALHREAGGLPRRLNRLADLALLIAFARDRPGVDAECVNLAAREASFDRAA